MRTNAARTQACVLECASGAHEAPMELTMKKRTAQLWMAGWMLAMLAACGSELPDDDVDVDLDAAASESDALAAGRGCVYVQYCNEPNSPRGIVCRINPGSSCHPAQDWTECASDARAVCGTDRGAQVVY
jgi:hypothetical protein